MLKEAAVICNPKNELARSRGYQVRLQTTVTFFSIDTFGPALIHLKVLSFSIFLTIDNVNPTDLKQVRSVRSLRF